MSLGKFDGISASDIGKLTDLNSANIGKVGGLALSLGGTWATTSNMNQARGYASGAGAVSASLVFGGSTAAGQH